MITRQMVDQFFLTDMVNTPTFREIQKQIQAKYTRDSDDEWPDSYYDEMNYAINALLIAALALNLPANLVELTATEESQEDGDNNTEH